MGERGHWWAVADRGSSEVLAAASRPGARMEWEYAFYTQDGLAPCSWVVGQDQPVVLRSLAEFEELFGARPSTVALWDDVDAGLATVEEGLRERARQALEHWEEYKFMSETRRRQRVERPLVRRGGWRTRWLVAWVRLLARTAWRWRDIWRAGLEAEWEQMAEEHRRRVCPHRVAWQEPLDDKDARCRGCGAVMPRAI